MSNQTTFSFKLEHVRAAARAGVFSTPHGQVLTPVFMPVGTVGSVKALDTQDIESTAASIILANTYHLYLRPGMEKLVALGGIHQLMGWSEPILTDSGGFQVFSLGQQSGQNKAHISDQGVRFTSHLDGTQHFFDPEVAIRTQQQIGADIIMAFDECTPDQADEQYAQQALQRTSLWAEQSVVAWEQKHRRSEYGQYQALFGIVQGAMHRRLREQSAHHISGLPVDGIAIGGETVGYNMAGTVELMNWLRPILPEHKPRYAMGLGRDPQNLVDAVLAGFDMFDCVAPTRLARNGTLYAGQLELKADQPIFSSAFTKGRLQIGNAQFALDTSPLSTTCNCHTCQAGYSRAYLHHLYKLKELTYYRLASIHNVTFMVSLAAQLRSWVMTGRVKAEPIY